MTFFSTYQSTDLPLLSTLYEPPPKHLISVLGSRVASMRNLDRRRPRYEYRRSPHVLASDTPAVPVRGGRGPIWKRWYPDMYLEVEEMPVAA
jgi:hypothetical protein